MPSAPATVTANFTSPLVSVTPTSINFGNVYLFNFKSKNVTVKNIGTSPLTISNVSLTQGSGDDFSFVSLCPRTLAAGKSCDITVFFFADDVKADSATLNVTDNAPGSPQQVSLSATVINPQPSFNPTSLHFGTVQIGHSRTENVILTNTGTTALTISSINVTGANPGDFTSSNACPSSLGPGVNCTISVTFTPSTTGSRSADLTVTDNAQSSKQNVPLWGAGSH
jgi:hypothetical protein